MIIWGDLTNINKITNLSLGLLTNIHKPESLFSKLLCKTSDRKTKKPRPQHPKRWKITSPRELQELPYQLTTLVSTIWPKNGCLRDLCFSTTPRLGVGTPQASSARRSWPPGMLGLVARPAHPLPACGATRSGRFLPLTSVVTSSVTNFDKGDFGIHLIKQCGP